MNNEYNLLDYFHVIKLTSRIVDESNVWFLLWNDYALSACRGGPVCVVVSVQEMRVQALTPL